MAEQKKKLKNLSRQDLRARKDKQTVQITHLKKKLTTAAPADTRAIQDLIKQKKERRQKINAILDKRAYQDIGTYHTPNGKTAEQAALNRIYSSDEYLRLSPENQQMIRGIVDNYSVGDLKKINITKKETRNLYRDAREATKKQFKGDIRKLDMDYEQSLRMDVKGLENSIASQTSQLQTDDAATADQRKITIRQLQDALDEAKTQYGVEATRKQDWLQTQLGDIKHQLDTSIGRANEDKVLELRQLERNYNSNLRDVQDNMASRGLAYSGIRAQSEQDLQGQYDDTRTTAQLEADRKSEDARRLAMEQERDSRVYTGQQLQDLVHQYTGQQQNAVQSAESVLGTQQTAGLLGNGAYNIHGNQVPSYLIGGLQGSTNQSTQNINTSAGSNLNNYYAEFERQYGTQALIDTFGKSNAGTIGATDTYTGYTPVGNQAAGPIAGTSTEQLRRNKEALRQERIGNIEQGVQLGKERLFMSKF